MGGVLFKREYRIQVQNACGHCHATQQRENVMEGKVVVERDSGLNYCS